jgi:hypothetical protein
VKVKISILKGSTSGTSVYSEVHSTTSNAFGIVNLSIGEGSEKSGSISTIDWSVDSYFVKVEMDENGGINYTLSSVSQLLSVPYALFANTVSSIDWSKIQSKPNLFSGSYNDLSNKPFNYVNNWGYTHHQGKTFMLGGYASASYRTDRYNLVVSNHDSISTKQGGVLIVGNDTTQVSGNLPQVPLEIIGTIKNVNYDFGPRNTQGRLISLHRADNSDPLAANNRFYIGISKNDKMYIGSCSEAGTVYFDYGKIGVGVESPKAGLHLKTGGIYIETPNSYDDSGIIMKTPDGSKCYKIKIDNSGNLITTQVTCP